MSELIAQSAPKELEVRTVTGVENGKHPYFKFTQNVETQKRLSKFLALLPKYGCFEAKTAKALGLSPTIPSRWKEDYPDFGPAVSQIRAWHKEERILKADGVIDNSMDSEDQRLALDAAKFTKRHEEGEKKHVTTKNLHLHQHKVEATNEYVEKIKAFLEEHKYDKRSNNGESSNSQES